MSFRPTTPQMNITPLIDVVFQLILFFMLVSNIVSNQAVEMIVPDLERPLTREMSDRGRVVVNIAPQHFSASSRIDSPLQFPGQARAVQIGNRAFDIADLSGMVEQLRQAKEADPNLEVLLRADSALFYDQVAPVMQAIAQAGISTVNLVAYMPDTTEAR